MRFWTRKDGLEQQLRTRHQARSSFVRDVASRMSANAPRRSAAARPTRFALVFAVLAVVGLAAFGGFGYAASGGHLGILGPAHIVKKAFSGPTTTTTTTGASDSLAVDSSSNSTKSNTNNAGGADNDPGNSGNTPADDQYKPGCGKGDKNHDHTGPPGNHNGFPGKCPDH